LAVCKHRSAENSKRKWAVRYKIATATQANRFIGLKKNQKITKKLTFSLSQQRHCRTMLFLTSIAA